MADTPPLNPFEVPEESALFEMNSGPQPQPFLDAQPLSSDESQHVENSGSRLIQIGQVLDGYHIIQLLGQGGMGAVYKARKDSVDYALKVLLADEIGASEIARFEREAQAAALVRHSNIVAVHKLALTGHCPYIVFDFVEGWSLDKDIVPGEPWTLSKAIERLKPVAAALDHIHDHNIVHRDLKPANIMIRAYDQAPMLADFGLAHAGQMERLTRTGEILGTPVYMTPEQLTGEAATRQTDVWPLGVILYEMLTGGERPFGGESTIALAQSILLKEPVSIARFVDVDAEALDYVFEKALAKETNKRYRSAGEFISDCEKVAAGDFRLSKELGVVELGQRRVKRAGRPVLIGFVLLLLFALGGAVALFNSNIEQAHEAWGEEQAASLKELKLKRKEFPRHFALEFFRRLTLLENAGIEDLKGPGAEFAAEVKSFKGRFEDQRAGKDKRFLSQLEKRLEGLEKTANSWEALVSMRADGDQKAFSLVDKDYQGLLVGYQALLKQQWDTAETVFRGIESKENEINVVVQFALLVTMSRQGEPLKALELLRKNEANLGGDFESFRTRLEREIFVNAVVVEALSPSVLLNLLKPFELKWQSRLKAEWTVLNSEIKTAFQKRLNAKARLKKLALAYRNVQECSRHNPNLNLLPLDERLARYLAENASLKSMAQVYYLELKRLNPQVRLPSEYTSRDKNRFSYYGLSNSFKLYAQKEYFNLFIELSRHNFYLPDTSPAIIRRFENDQKQFLTETLKRYPNDIYLRLWRGYCKESDRLNDGYSARMSALKKGDKEQIRLTDKVAAELEEALQSRLNDLAKALAPGTLHPLFEGLAKHQMCEIYLVRTLLRSEKNLVLKEKSLKLIQSAPKLVPSPSELSNLELRWLLYYYRGRDKKRCLEIADRGLKELATAFAYPKLNDSENQRPLGLPFMFVPDEKYPYQKAGWYGLKAETYERSAEYLKAHDTYRESILVKVNDRVLGQWINMIRHHGNLKELEDINETILRTKRDDKGGQHLSPFQRKVCDLFLERDYERTKAFLKKRGPK